MEKGERTGGQKSFWKSTMMRAGVNAMMAIWGWAVTMVDRMKQLGISRGFRDEDDGCEG
jgi:hypothetical protein